MTPDDPARHLLTLLARTLRPSYGARRNAADGVRSVRAGRSDRAQASAAFAATARAMAAPVPARTEGLGG